MRHLIAIVLMIILGFVASYLPNEFKIGIGIIIGCIGMANFRNNTAVKNKRFDGGVF